MRTFRTAVQKWRYSTAHLPPHLETANYTVLIELITKRSIVRLVHWPCPPGFIGERYKKVLRVFHLLAVSKAKGCGAAWVSLFSASKKTPLMNDDTSSYLQILTRCCPMCGGHTREVDRTRRSLRGIFVKTRFCPSCGIRFQLDPFSTLMRLVRGKRMRQPYIAVEPEYPTVDTDLHMAFTPSRTEHAAPPSIEVRECVNSPSKQFALELAVHKGTIEMHVHLDTQPIIESAQHILQLARELTVKSFDKAIQLANDRQPAKATQNMEAASSLTADQPSQGCSGATYAETTCTSCRFDARNREGEVSSQGILK